MATPKKRTKAAPKRAKASWSTRAKRSMRRRWRKANLIRKAAFVLGAGIVSLFVLLVGVGAIDNALHDNQPLRNVTVAGTNVGGLSSDDLRATISTLGPKVESQPVQLVGQAGTRELSAADVGLHIDVDATAAASLEQGRGSFSPLRWIGRLFSKSETPVSMTVDPARLAEALKPFGTPVDNRVSFALQGGLIEVNAAQTGIAADVEAIGAALIASAQRGDSPIAANVDTTQVAPDVDQATRQALADRANAATSGGIVLALGNARSKIDATTLRRWMQPTEAGDDYELNSAVVTAAIANRFTESRSEGRDAKVVVFENNVIIAEGEPATECCGAQSAAAINQALHEGQSTVELEFLETSRPKGREWAATLGIKENVGEFTTYYPAGQSRVVNIKRIAELTKGAVVEPGGTFSINEYVGRRTIENGFVSGGVIEDGVFQSDVGGGISQYATTLFNAAFFGGLDFDTYQSHSIYISRYPYGREATVSFPAPDLKIKNTTPYGVLIWTTATDTSLTIQMWSTEWATGEQTGQSESQVGTSCTKVTTERTRTYADGRKPVVDTVFALYQPGEGVNCAGRPTAGATTTVAPPTTTTEAPVPTTTVAPAPTTTPAPVPTTTVAPAPPPPMPTPTPMPTPPGLATAPRRAG